MALKYSQTRDTQTMDLTRRNLIKAINVAPILGVLSNCDSGESSNVEVVPIGLQAWSIRNSLENDPKGTLLKLARFGFNELELFDISSTEPIAKLAQSIGYDLVGLHFWELFDEVGSWVRWIKTKNEAELIKNINLDFLTAKAKEYGMRHVVFAGDAPESACTDMRDAYHYCKAIEAVGKAIRGHGLRFLYHPHMADLNDLGDGVTLFDQLVQLTDPADVGFEIDVFWFAHVGGNPAVTIQKLGARADIIHLKDRKRGVPLASPLQGYPEEKSLFVPAGKGSVDFNAILTAAKAAGTRHLIIEQDEAEGDPFLSLQQSYSHLRGVLASM
jgi:sugar phosphate isomerase/epimerase